MSKLNRQRWLGAAEIYLEEKPDLASLVEELAGDHPEILDLAEISETLLAYSQQVDQELNGLARHMIKYARTFFRTTKFGTDGHSYWQEGSDPNAPDDLERWVKRKNEFHRRLRDLNRRYAAAIEGLLPENLRPVFQERYAMAAFRGVIDRRLLQSESFINTVLEVESLTDKQRKNISDLRVQYEARRDQAHKEMIKAHDRYADSGFDNSLEPAREALKTALREAIEKRYVIENDLVASVWVFLDESQQPLVTRPPPIDIESAVRRLVWFD